MEEQMELFEDGGLKDEGGMVDEESGNEVPSGSTKKEVRDDIPAMLSEGEFVLPADVVRYHGLEKIMQLRDEAKFGLKKMEAMGQMGNSDEATLDDDVPFGPADLIIVGAEPMEDEPREMYQGGMVYAQEGTFVKPSTGIAGYQPSIYQGQQTTGAYTPPPSSVAPPIPAPSPAGGYVPKFVSSGQIPVGVAPPPVTPASSTDTSAVSTASTEDKPFVPTVSDVYTSVEYINPETGERRMFNFYNGAVVNGPIPEGFIPVTEWEASQTDTGTTTTTGTGTDDTSVATTQVTTDDGGAQTIRELQQKQQQRESQELSIQKTNLLQKGSANDLVSAWLDNKRVLGAGNVGSFFSPLIGAFTTAAGLKQQRDLESALTERFGEDWKTTAKLTDEVKKELTEYEESGKLRNTKLFGNKLFEDVKAAVSGIKDSFTEEGRQSYYEKYASSGPVHNVADNTLSGGVTGFEAVTDSSGALQMNQHGMPQSSGNLSLKEQQSYDNAVRDGNASVANHHAIIAAHRDRQNQYADALARGDTSAAAAIGANMSAQSRDQAERFGGSVHRASESGTASKNTSSGLQFFSKFVPNNDNDGGSDTDSDSGSNTGGYSCYVATALNNKGYWPTVKKMKLIKWCMDAKPEDKFDTKLWRNGYTVFGKTVIAPHVDNKIIQWLSDGFYDSRVKNKKDIKSFTGLLFFYIPSYTIALYKMLRNDLVDIERT